MNLLDALRERDSEANVQRATDALIAAMSVAAETLSCEGKLGAQQIARRLLISESTLSSYLRHRGPRALPAELLKLYCERIAAIKGRTSNKKGRHPSTSESIRRIDSQLLAVGVPL